MSLELDASPSTDMEATPVTLVSTTAGSDRSVPSSKYSPTEARDEESGECRMDLVDLLCQDRPRC